jgi:hypothetical protein
MNLPIQAAPVMRGHLRVHQIESLKQQRCNWLTCGSAVIACATACVSSGSAACIACLGPLYESCKDCF